MSEEGEEITALSRLKRGGGESSSCIGRVTALRTALLLVNM